MDQAEEHSKALTNAEVAEAIGRSAEETRRFWLGLGFPDSGDHAVYSSADLEVITAWSEALSRAGLDVDLGIRAIRPIGQSAVRMSEWQVAATGTSSASGVIDPVLEDVLVHAWRRHLAIAHTRAEADASATAPQSTAESTQIFTVGFADLVNFSALSNELDVVRVADLVEIFESRAADVVARCDGQIIKTLGDSVLFVALDAPAALAIAQGLVEMIGSDKRLPDVRIGMATGPVVSRLGDVFGPPVNLAARLTGVARRNRIIIDAATEAGLNPSVVRTHRLSPRKLRGFGLVEPIALR